MLPEVTQYVAARKKASQEWEDWRSESRNNRPERPQRPSWSSPSNTDAEYEYLYREYERQYREWNTKYHERYSKEQMKYQIAIQTARDVLRAKTKDPMAVWMIDNLPDHWEYVEKVLPILPASREDLEDLANEHDWCNEFDSFLDQATEAGVVPPLDVKYDASDLIEWVADKYGENEREIRHAIQSRVNAMVEKALAIQNNEKATA